MKKLIIDFGKFLFRTFLVLMLGLGLLVLGLKFPKVQTVLVQKVSAYLSQKLGTEVSVGGVNLSWFDALVLDDVSVKDHHQAAMILIKKLEVNFKLSAITDTNKITIDHLHLTQPKVQLIQYKNEKTLNINEFIDRVARLLESKTPKAPTKSKPFIIDEADIEDGTFSLDYKADPYLNQPGLFEYSHFTLDKIYGEVLELSIINGVLAIEVEDLKCRDKASNLTVKELNTVFTYGDKEMRFDNLYAHINNSKIRNFLTFKYNSTNDFSDFNRKVRMEANFDSTTINTDDIARFAAPMRQFKDSYSLDGQFAGTVQDFKLQKSKVYFGKNSRLTGDFSFKGLPNVEKTLMDFKMQKTSINAKDLEQYVGTKVAKPITKFGTILLTGTFNGLYNNFVTKVNYKTALGDVFADLDMKITPNLDNSTYQGNLDLIDFDLGKLIDNKALLQKIAISGKIVGQGFDINKATLNLNADIEHVGVDGYDYDNIYVNGQLQKGLFDGKVSIKDTNLVFDAIGRIDLRNNLNRFDIEGKLTKSNLKPLHFTDKETTLQSELSLHFDGLDIDKIKGTGKFRNTFLIEGENRLSIDSMYVYSFISSRDSSRSLGVNSTILDAYATGKFSLSQAILNLSEVFNEYKLYFFDNEENRKAYYARKMFTPISSYAIDYRCTIKDALPLMRYLYKDGYISPQTKLEGSFKVGNTTRLDLVAKTDTIKLGAYQFYGTDIEINTSKFANSPEVLASTYIKSKQQKISALAPTENLSIEAIWDLDRIAFNGSLAQIKSNNTASLDGDLKFVPKGIELQFGRSKFHILDGDWLFNPQNQISISGNEVMVNNLFVKNGEQQIGINGLVSADSSQTLKLETTNFKLQNLAPILEIDLNGTVNGSALLRDLYKNVNLDGNLSVKDLIYNKFLIGNVLSEGKWDKEKQQINIDSYIERLGVKTLTLEGRYSPQKEKALSIKANLNQTNLDVLEPFTKNILSQITGTATGIVDITGTVTKPILNGEIAIKKGRVKFDYLNTIWNFEDRIYFSESEITAKKLSVTDDEGNPAIVTGGIFHDGFEFIQIDVKANMKNFKVLNTTAKNNGMYYGTAYVTGKLAIEGPLKTFGIKADVRSNRNTKIYIPLDGGANTSTEEYVEFVNFRNTKKDSSQIIATNEVELQGIKMDFNLDITPDATVEIQFDSQSGDVIKANGNGKLALNASTTGDFSMTGNYVIEKGDYTFTFQNILNKKFLIRPNSSISWNGDPYNAILDMKAVYTQNTSLYPILDTTQTRNEPQYKRRYPVNVVLNLSEKLTAPRIGYDVEIKDYPQLPAFNSGVTAFNNKIREDEQELSRQVSSVIALGQLLPQDPLRAFGNDNLLNNLSELISNQISSWVSQLDKNLQIDVQAPIANLNQSLINNLQFKFSYNFNDRLRITRNGGFTNAQNQTDNLSLIGDWSLEWLITKDGKLRLKGYNRNIQNPFSSLNNSAVTTTTGGASLLYTQSFNRFLPKKKKPVSEVTGLKVDLMP